MTLTHLREGKTPAWANVSVKGVDEKTGEFEAVASKEIVDRDGEIVRVGSFEKRLATFLKNPVLLFNHNWHLPPIGEVKSITVNGDQLDFVGKFRPVDEVKEPLLQDAVSAGRTGYLRSFSIGFRAFEIKTGKDDAGNRLPPEITDAEIYEISLATIPANVDAVMKSARFLKLIDPASLPQDMLPVREIVKTLYSVPGNRGFVERAKEILARVEQEKRSGIRPAGDLLKSADALRRFVWALGEPEPDANDEAVNKALEELLAVI